MTQELKPGSRWQSAVDDTQVIIVKAPATAVELQCGGHAMVPVGGDVPAGLATDPAFAEPTPIGKRFADEASGLEVLATKGGAGTLGLDGVAIALKDAKPLPASD